MPSGIHPTQSPKMSRSKDLLDAFDFEPGMQLVGKYEVLEKLGAGYEGEVYRIRERSTGVDRAGKFFYPHRNPHDRAVKYYARMLHKLRDCPILIQYVTHEKVMVGQTSVSFLVSEFAEGEVLHDFLAKQPGKRLTPFEALHLLHTLSKGKRDTRAKAHAATGSLMV